METSKQTLCWSCEKACGKCSWSDGTFTPVDGWESEPPKVKKQNAALKYEQKPISKSDFDALVVDLGEDNV